MPFFERGASRRMFHHACVAQPDANVDWQTRELSSPPSWQTTGKNCEFAWLIITGSAWDSTTPFRGHVKELVLRQDDKDQDPGRKQLRDERG